MSLPVPIMPLALAGALVAAVSSSGLAATDMPPAQREAIEGIIHDYLIHNPDVLIEALRGAEDKLNREADANAAACGKNQLGVSPVAIASRWPSGLNAIPVPLRTGSANAGTRSGSCSGTAVLNKCIPRNSSS